MKLSILNLQCRRVRFILWEYLSNLLSSDDRQMVEHHLSQCDGCSKEMVSIAKVQKMLSSERNRSLPAHRHNFNEVQRALIVDNSSNRKNVTLIAGMCAASAAVAALLTFGALVPLQRQTMNVMHSPDAPSSTAQVKPQVAAITHTIIKKVYIVRTIVKKPSETELAAAYNQALLNLAIQHPELAALRSHFTAKSNAANLLASYNHKIAMNSRQNSHKSSDVPHNSSVVMMPVQHVTHYTTTILEPAVYDSMSTY